MSRAQVLSPPESPLLLARRMADAFDVEHDRLELLAALKRERDLPNFDWWANHPPGHVQQWPARRTPGTPLAARIIRRALGRELLEDRQ